MLQKIADFFKTGPNKPVITDSQKITREYEPKRWSVFLSVTLGYGLYYVCRLNFSVIKKPLMEQGILNGHELGLIGSVLFMTYAFGKFFNGFLADRLNIKRFISCGLLISALLQICLGNILYFWLFVALWGINGWFQSFGAAPSVVALSQWFSARELGTYYGIWIISHNLGAAFSYYGTGWVVTHWGWQSGFLMPGVICSLGAIALYYGMHDRPQTLGLPPVAEYKGDVLKPSQKESVWELQREVLRNPAVWILGLSSACMYIARYAIESWGVVYLGAQKLYSTMEAGQIMFMSQMCGLVGTALSGWITDRFFQSRRNLVAFLFGVLYALSLGLFLWYPGHNVLFDYINMAIFGFSLGVLLCFLGGLMAVDICSKRATGAAMGMIGFFSYFAASMQDYVSGYLINAYKIEKIVANQKVIVYDFFPVSCVWVTAAVLSCILAAFVWKAKHQG